MFPFIRSAWLPVLILILVAVWMTLERSPEEPSAGVVLRWVINSQERDVQFAMAAKRAFEARHPGIRIEFIKQNEGNKTETMIAGGDGPDIVLVGMDKVHYYVKAGVLRDLTPLMSPQDRADLASFFPVTVGP